MIKRLMYLLLLSFLLNSCFMNSHTNKQLKGSYYLIAADSESQMTISEQVSEDSFVGIIESTVFEYQVYNDYILAKNKEYKSESNQIKYHILNTSSGKVSSYDEIDKFNLALTDLKIEANGQWIKAY